MKIDPSVAFDCALKAGQAGLYADLCDEGMRKVIVQANRTRAVIMLGGGRKCVVARAGHGDWRVMRNDCPARGEINAGTIQAFGKAILKHVRREAREGHPNKNLKKSAPETTIHHNNGNHYGHVHGGGHQYGHTHSNGNHYGHRC